MLAGFETATHGEIKLDGKPINNIPPHKRGIGMVFQHFNLFPHLTILDNLTVGPIWVRKMPKKEAEELAMHYLEIVKIPEQAQKYPGQVSGGQQQRVALARALVPELAGDTDALQLLMGTDEQKAHYLPRILSGEDTWCQGYSEPNAGSDLGNVGLRAVLDGDQWVLNGQKIWTSAGHLADHIFTLARTDPDAPKHKGISFLLVDMRQPGIEVRPIKMISGESEFNEVFYTDARCPKENVVGGVNNGWAVAMSLLGFERGEAAATGPIRYQAELDRLVHDADQTAEQLSLFSVVSSTAVGFSTCSGRLATAAPPALSTNWKLGVPLKPAPVPWATRSSTVCRDARSCTCSTA